ncbi:MAG TPA: capsular biosynthesis protein [Aromatoleum sp.]|uniref:capsule biosynthesis protein n=1 Tax=Aromatoleum sp. TaxID=2307007 RepID=UPI002B477121|nr:capsular biosynthesis protein [Aromatoleum sp.]HJV25570.1 capsular biosynthesis protein [Aromatoleum sp.]
MRRNFLLLQGPGTPFFGRLADRLAVDGHGVFRVNFNGGDLAYWRGRPAWNFRGTPDALRDFLDDKYRRNGITDQILFGDRRPAHRPAVDHGDACGVRTHVFEEGYFRPHWVTLEREGVNGHSLLPRDPDWFREAVHRLPASTATITFRSPFWVRAAHDVTYHAAGSLNPVLFPRYRTHSSITAPVEYAGYLKRFATLRVIRGREWRRVEALASSGVRYYVLPLQLNTDAQIRDHSRFDGMEEVITYVLESFARHAPSDTRLAIKNHPLDMGLVPYRALIRRHARDFGVADRVDYFEDGNLGPLIEHSLGVVTVNSTVGIVSLELGIPTVALSDPIYNLPGLTSQAPLDDFWASREPPDRDFVGSFRRVVMHATQVNGGFYCRPGIALAVENSARVLTAECSPLEQLL